MPSSSSLLLSYHHHPHLPSILISILISPLPQGLLGVVEDLTFTAMVEMNKLTPLNPKPVHVRTLLAEAVESAFLMDERGSTRESIDCQLGSVPPHTPTSYPTHPLSYPTYPLCYAMLSCHILCYLPPILSYPVPALTTTALLITTIPNCRSLTTTLSNYHPI